MSRTKVGGDPTLLHKNSNPQAHPTQTPLPLYMSRGAKVCSKTPASGRVLRHRAHSPASKVHGTVATSGACTGSQGRGRPSQVFRVKGSGSTATGTRMETLEALSTGLLRVVTREGGRSNSPAPAEHRGACCWGQRDQEKSDPPAQGGGPSPSSDGSPLPCNSLKLGQEG